MPVKYRDALKKTYHHDKLRQKIIDEALLSIEQENIISLSLRKIARSLEISHNAPYRHFPDKESLLVEIATIGFTQLYQKLQNAFDSCSLDACQILDKIGVAYIEYAINNQTYYQVMFSDRQLICDKHPELGQISQAAFTVLVNAIKTGQDSRIFISGDTLQLALICWSTTHEPIFVNRNADKTAPKIFLKLTHLSKKYNKCVLHGQRIRTQTILES